MKTPEQCPNCNNEGFTTETEIRDIGYFEEDLQERQIQAQCEFCYCNENSIFNHNKMINRLKGEHLK